MIEEAFEVATEFKFDVGSAVFNTDALRSSVDALSASADGALGSLNYLAGGLVAHLGLGSGGLLSIFRESVRLSEEFHTGSMGFLNSIGSNINVLKGGVHGFNEQLATSSMLMAKVGAVADKFGFSGGQLASMTQLFASPLAQRGKLGTNFENGIELAKNAMIVGESTGMGSQMMSESLLRGLSPGGTVMGKLFERLVNTSTFRKAGIIHPAQLASMMPDRKIDLLTRAMSELGNNAGYLNERMNDLSVMFNIVKGRLGAVLTPIGDALKTPILQIFKSMGDYLQQNGAELGKNISALIKDIFKDPKALILNLMQVKNVGSDFHLAAKFAEFFLIFNWMKGMIEELTGFKFKGPIFLLMNALRGLWTIISWGSSILWKFRGFFWDSIIVPFLKFTVALSGWFILFQGLSRAKAQARFSDAEDVVQLAPRLTATILQWKKFFTAFISPVQEFIQAIADVFEPLFKWSNWLLAFVWVTEKLTPLLESLSYFFLSIAAAIHAMVDAVKQDIIQIYTELKAGNFLQAGKDLIGMDGGALDQKFMKSYDDYADKAYAMMGKSGDSVSKAVYNTTNNINANFNMREQLEPDRVAFAVTQHLKKLVFDKTQAAGHSIGSGFVNKQGAVVGP